jgi:hypothetical protein
MKFGFLNLIERSTLPALLVGSLLAFSSAAPLLAQERGSGGHGGGSGGHSSSGGSAVGHSFSGGGSAGRSYGGAQRGSSGGERSFAERGNFQGGDRAYRGDRDYGRRGYYGGGFGYGYYGGPVYGHPYGAYGCDPAGYYDQFGNWQPYPGCYVAPY